MTLFCPTHIKQSLGQDGEPSGGEGGEPTYQELGGAEHVQRERLDPGVVDPQLPVDPRALDAHQDAQVGGQPGGVWERGREREQ